MAGLRCGAPLAACLWVYIQVFAGLQSGEVKAELRPICPSVKNARGSPQDPSEGFEFYQALNRSSVSFSPAIARATRARFLLPSFLPSPSSLTEEKRGNRAWERVIILYFHGQVVFNPLGADSFGKTLLHVEQIWFELVRGVDVISKSSKWKQINSRYNEKQITT